MGRTTGTPGTPGNPPSPPNAGPMPQAPMQPGGFTNFRPPPGFMDDNVEDSSVPSLNTEEMLNRLQQGRGKWHELAGYLPKLQREGIDGSIVEEMSGVDRRTQNLWVNSSMVYASLKKSGSMSEDTLAYFDQDGGHLLLSDLRFLSVDQRVATAQYIVSQRMDDQQSTVLARAVKEHERRKGENEGFSDQPADCLAYKYYRDAIENKRQEEVEVYITKGLEVAVTEGARGALEGLAKSVEMEVAVAEGGKKEVKLDVVRLLKEESGYRCIPVVGNLGGLDVEVVRRAPVARTSGVFGIVEFDASGGDVSAYSWASVPSWSATAGAGRLVAVEVTNCAGVKAIRSTSGVSTEKDALKIMGEGLVLVDLEDTGDINGDVESYYIGKGKDGAFDLLTLDEIQGDVLGKVVLVCRPPGKQTSESFDMNDM